MADQSRDVDFGESGPSVVFMSRNPSVSFGRVWLRGHPVPYLEVFKVPVDDENQQVYPISEDSDGTTTVHPHDGKYRWELTLDQRWCYDFGSESELVHFATAIADAMAVATGRACHGSANRLSLHGPIYADAVVSSSPGGMS